MTSLARTDGPVVTPSGVQTANADARELSSQTRANSAAKFEGVYAHNMKFVLGTLRNMGVQDSALDDAAQEVFVVVHRRLSSFDGLHSIRSWLFAIALRIASAVRRSSRRNRTQARIDLEMEDAAPSPHELAERAQTLRASAKLLAGLNANQRAVLSARGGGGHDRPRDSGHGRGGGQHGVHAAPARASTPERVGACRQVGVVSDGGGTRQGCPARL